MPQEETIHATTVALNGLGVLIAGPSGSGKSDLALRLIDRGAALVADDQTLVRAEGGTVFAYAPSTIAGRLDVRGVGILSTEAATAVPLALCVSLTEDIDRLPEPRSRMLAGVTIPELRVDPRPASAPIKVELALAHPEMVIA